MKQTEFFIKTTKTVPKDIKITSHRLLYQAGFIRESAPGRYCFLPLGMRVRDKIIRIIEQEMNKAGAIKIITPVLHPIKLWEETNRTNAIGFELMIVKDRFGSKFALGGTAEEIIVDLVRKFNLSYKDLPFNIYQFSQKFRDELRARGGLLRLREFLMKDGYSFHRDKQDFQREYQNMRDTYTKIFNRIGLDTIVVESDNGYIGGDFCHEFVVESDVGESVFLVSQDNKYAAHKDVAKFRKTRKNLNEKQKKIKQVDAKRGKTMEHGMLLHNLPLWQQIKNVMFVDEKNRFILAIIRGDFNINEVKLKNLIQARSLRQANEQEIRELGSEPGFISPVNINKKVIIVADDSLRTIKNSYGGANKKYKDLLNVNIDRDYLPNIEGDIAMAQQGFLSKQGSRLRESKGIEVGNIFQLGYHYSKKMNAFFIDKDGKERFYYMGCYGIGIDRTIAAVVEKHCDKQGIIWPEVIAPYNSHLIYVNSGKKNKKIAEKIYKNLEKQEKEVLYDDREDKTAGEKFIDADLIGIPWRIVVSEKTLKKDSIEIKKRGEKKIKLIKLKKFVR